MHAAAGRGRHLTRGQTIVLRGQATEAGGTTVPASRLRWSVGRRVVARGPVLRATMPKRGVLHLRLEARGGSGKIGRAASIIRAAPTPSRAAVAKAVAQRG